MKKNYCWIIGLLDKSGSMFKIKNDVIGGFNSFFQKQNKENLGECKVFLYSFSSDYQTMLENADLKDIPQLDDKKYIPNGSTALYDSLGKTIFDIGKKLENLSENERPENVLCIILTDGEHNSNLKNQEIHYDLEKVKEMVKHQTEVYKWDFAFLGSNIDSWSVGNGMGLTSGTTLDYTSNSGGVAYAFNNLCSSTTQYRSHTLGGSKKAFSFDKK